MIHNTKYKQIISISLLIIFLLICTFTVYIKKYSDIGNEYSNSRDSYESFNTISCKKITNFSLDDETDYYDLLSDNQDHLLLYWATWCPHCENLIRSKFWKSNAGTVERNLFSIAEDSSADQIRNESPRFPVYIDSDWQQFNNANCRHLPTLIVVSGDGSVLGSAEGEEECKRLLKVYVHRNRTQKENTNEK